MLADEFASVVAERRSIFVRVAAGILKDTEAAEDAVQKALLNTWVALPDFRGDSQLATWLTRAVINQALIKNRATRFRREKSREIEQQRVVFATPNPEQLHLTEETRALVRREILRAPVMYRDALLIDLIL